MKKKYFIIHLTNKFKKRHKTRLLSTHGHSMYRISQKRLKNLKDVNSN